MKTTLLNICAVSTFLIGTSLHASTVVDQGVDATGFQPNYGIAENDSTTQNFMRQFTLAAPTVLTGAAIYSQYGNLFVFVNTPVFVHFRENDGSQPAAVDLTALHTVISTIDNFGSQTYLPSKRLAVDLPNIALAAGTYWFGMTGDASNIGWDFDVVYAGGQPLTQQFSGNSPNTSNDLYALPFQLYDATAGVPEPANWALLIAGFGLVGAMQRRRRMAVAS